MRLKIVYDNEALKGYKKDWGFSCLVEGEKNILFDTGAKADILLENMKKMGIDVKKIDAVVLSHNHRDHTGGLSALEGVFPRGTIVGKIKSVKQTKSSLLFDVLVKPAVEFGKLEEVFVVLKR